MHTVSVMLNSWHYFDNASTDGRFFVGFDGGVARTRNDGVFTAAGTLLGAPVNNTLNFNGKMMASPGRSGLAGNMPSLKPCAAVSPTGTLMPARSMI